MNRCSFNIPRTIQHNFKSLFNYLHGHTSHNHDMLCQYTCTYLGKQNCYLYGNKPVIIATLFLLSVQLPTKPKHICTYNCSQDRINTCIQSFLFLHSLNLSVSNRACAAHIYSIFLGLAASDCFKQLLTSTISVSAIFSSLSSLSFSSFKSFSCFICTFSDFLLLLFSFFCKLLFLHLVFLWALPLS